MNADDLTYRDGDFGARIFVCTNSEMVCEGTEFRESDGVAKSEAASEVTEAIGDMLVAQGADYISSGFFADWNGGKHARGDLRCGLIVANTYKITQVLGDYGEEIGEECKWTRPEEFSADKVDRLVAILDSASKAGTEKMNQLEAEERDRQKRYAEEDAAEADAEAQSA